MKKNKLYQFAAGLLCATAMFSGCSEEFLKPDPLSFYEPTTTFSTESGLRSALAMVDRHLRTYWSFYSTQDLSLPISSQYVMSDLMVSGKTDDSNIFIDVATRLTPQAGLNNDNTNRLSYFWGESYTGIKYANTVISFIDGVEGLDEATRLEYKGRAYFHRAFRYMGLCFMFRDVPLVTKILEVPKLNYRTTKREAILDMLKQDMEKAVQWVPEQKDMALVGMVNKGACRQLLIKIYLATGEWDKAIAQADTLIDHSGYSLMTNTFGTFINPHPNTWPITRNVIWDLHRPENKCIAANKEVILGMPNREGTDATIKLRTMRNWLPWWNASNIQTPDLKTTGVQVYAAQNSNGTANANYDMRYDYGKALGRGIAHVRPTYFAEKSVWYVNGVNDEGDLRHSSKVGNWARMDSLHYNNRSSSYYGENLQLYNGTTLLCSDTIRCWFDWPHYKFWINDPDMDKPTESSIQGGAADWYCYRLAETYLLRAEAKYYKGDIAGATGDVNKVRERAQCDELYTTVNIGSIMDERARELYMEEWRYAELNRVSLSLALSGKTDEWGNTYDVNTYDKQEGTDDQGGSYWYQRIVHYNNYYNKNADLKVKNRPFTMGKHNLYLPIPRSAIDANRNGQLSQNFGYDGYDPATPKWETWQEAVIDEDRTE